MFKHLAEFGGADNREAFKAAAAFLRKNSGYTLEIPQNEYVISSDHAKRLQSAVMTGKLSSPPDKFNRAISFSGIKNAVIRGNGAVISGGGITELLHLKDCENIELCDLSLKLSRPLFSTGIIESCRDTSRFASVTIHLDDYCPVNLTTPIVSACAASDEGYIDLDAKSIKIIDNYTAEANICAPDFDLLGAKICICHACRLLPAIHIENCKSITFSNVRVLSSAGDALLIENSRDISLLGFSFAPPFENCRLLTGDAVVTNKE